MLDPDQALAQFKQAVLPKLHKVKHTSATIYYREAKLKLAEASARLLEEFSDQYPEVAMPLKKLTSYINSMVDSVINPPKEEGDGEVFIPSKWISDLRKRKSVRFKNPTEWDNLNEYQIQEEYFLFEQQEGKNYAKLPKDTLILSAAAQERQIHLKEERAELAKHLAYDPLVYSNLIEEIVEVFTDWNNDPEVKLSYTESLRHYFWGIKNKLLERDVSKQMPLIICFKSSVQAVGKNTLIDLLGKPLKIFYKHDVDAGEIADQWSRKVIAEYAMGHMDEFGNDRADIAKLKSFVTAFSKGNRGMRSEVYRSYNVFISLIISTNYNLFSHIRDESGLRRFSNINTIKSEAAFALFRQLATEEGSQRVIDMYRAIDPDAPAPVSVGTPAMQAVRDVQEKIVFSATLEPFLEKYAVLRPRPGDTVTTLPISALHEVFAAYCTKAKKFVVDPLKFPTLLLAAKYPVNEALNNVEVIISQDLNGSLREAGYRNRFPTRIYEG